MEAQTRRQRLEQLLNLAQTYKGWNRKQLAKALGRDTTKLVPESGLPKLDLLMDLTEVLDWPVEEVARYLWEAESVGRKAEVEGESKQSFESLESASKSAHREGRYAEAVALAQQAYHAAESNEQRAIACNREASGWDGLGRYTKALEATKRGLVEPGLSSDRRLVLQVSLANQYYTLWQLVESGAIAQGLVQRYAIEPPKDRINRAVQAHATYVRGHSNRRLMLIEEGDSAHLARQAKQDLLVAASLFEQLAADFDDDSYRGVANTCTGGLMEVEAALGQRDPKEVLRAYVAALNKLVEPEKYPRGDWLESYGWWCIFGCNVALRHLTEPREIQQHMALFTNKADEIAGRLDNWAIRERVFVMDFVRRERFADWTGVQTDWSIDKSDVRLLAGTMARFPSFQQTGWRILQSARIVAD